MGRLRPKVGRRGSARENHLLGGGQHRVCLVTGTAAARLPHDFRAEARTHFMDDHIDKLLNYIRYWQASGESLKTSARTKTRLSQIVQEGRFRGGIVPYGYRLEKQGRFNKKNHEVNEILIDPDEAVVVRIIFEKYVYEGFGAQRLSRWLYNNGYLNRKGTNFANTTIIKMLKNIMYVGILRSGERLFAGRLRQTPGHHALPQRDGHHYTAKYLTVKGPFQRRLGGYHRERGRFYLFGRK